VRPTIEKNNKKYKPGEYKKTRDTKGQQGADKDTKKHGETLETKEYKEKSSGMFKKGEIEGISKAKREREQ